MRSIARLIRLPLRAIPPTMVVRVLSGPARGARWIAGSSNHGCWLGTYESTTQRILAGLLRPGTVFYDVGANVGFYTVMAAHCGAVVHAFEPDENNLYLLRQHVQLNRLGNVVIHAAAVAARDGHGMFEAAGSMGHLADHGRVVRTVALDTMDAPPPSLIKIDVEGGELGVLRGALRLLERHQPAILLEPHGKFLNGKDVDQECLSILRGLGYSCTRLRRGDFLCVPGRVTRAGA